jgi:sodium/proline symporter
MIETIFILYLLLIICVGIFSNKFVTSQLDFLLAGRRLGPWVTAFSERASGESAWLLLGLPGAAIAIGYGEIWAVIGITIGIISSWFLIAEKLRDETEKLNSLTIPDFLDKKFNDSSGLIRIISALIIGIFFTFYVSAQFHGSGKILNTIFGIEPLYGITLSAIIIIIYTILGGLLAVAWTDLIQGVLMIGTLVILPIVGIFELLSFDQSLSELLKFDGLERNSIFSGLSGIGALSVALGGMSWGLGYFGQPHLLIRYMAIKSVKDVRKAKWIAALWAIPGISGAFMIGIVALGYFGEEFFVGKDTEIAMPLLAQTLLPAWIAGLLISGAVAAMMSTADSQLLVSTSAISEDLKLNKFIKTKNSNKLTNTRYITIILGLFAYVTAMYSEISGDTIFGIVSFAWSGLGSSFGPAVILSLWWSKTTREGIISGLLTGSIVTIIWGSIPFLQSIVTERLTSFVLAFFAVILVSKLTFKEKKRNSSLNGDTHIQSGSYGIS